MSSSAERYLIVLERSETGFSTYSPDVSGCIATGATIDEAVQNMREALTLHLQAMLEDGESVPQPRGVQSYLDAAEDSAGEEYYLTHVAVSSVAPEGIPA